MSNKVGRLAVPKKASQWMFKKGIIMTIKSEFTTKYSCCFKNDRGGVTCRNYDKSHIQVLTDSVVKILLGMKKYDKYFTEPKEIRL